MRKPGKLLKSKATFNRDELADLFEDLAARIREGELTLGQGDGQVSMDLPQTFTVEMEVQNTGKRVLKRELELEIEWPIEADGTPLEGRDPRSGFVIN
ncbi:MAG: amphi-Trp domain-containing protein [Corynebacterium humireducens]|jgi:amphi-Trp domain-containing protein|uniref:Amphi-Trp domain-containing protein n=1 Tax=Corynebacterium humireducens TaxID=1223514 RepID=A0A7X6PKN1_9CORY|nr:amphi-Trp domain-containing protein [Corynebacterium sp.]NLA54735.1 amphi-Trp domain-containing protein [Corynebacterium humireducens]HHU66292.1 amphi-Trp domain-containing protein [Corynebacterium sp.]HKM24117.1 amphi-Trp domain-containing protein [Corynebacterium sp.]